MSFQEIITKTLFRQCLSSYKSENMLIKPNQKCQEDNKTTLRTPSESHLH